MSLKAAFADMAETLRRVFQAPPSRSVPTAFPEPAQGSTLLLESSAKEVPYRFLPSPRTSELLSAPTIGMEATSFQAVLQAEDSFSRWASGAVVCEMPVFQAGGCARVGVPPLPRNAATRRVEPASFRVSLRAFREWVAAPSTRGGSPAIPAPVARQALNVALGLPIAVSGQSFPSLSKALGMRYTLQLVRATGENIRNLDILGVYQIPKKGVKGLRHDPRTGRVLLDLGAEASGAPRASFILAMKKDDRSYVSSFVED
jgi:hypothetical protein